jgi:hypothetical protein
MTEHGESEDARKSLIDSVKGGAKEIAGTFSGQQGGAIPFSLRDSEVCRSAISTRRLFDEPRRSRRSGVWSTHSTPNQPVRDPDARFNRRADGQCRSMRARAAA